MDCLSRIYHFTNCTAISIATHTFWYSDGKTRVAVWNSGKSPFSYPRLHHYTHIHTYQPVCHKCLQLPLPGFPFAKKGFSLQNWVANQNGEDKYEPKNVTSFISEYHSNSIHKTTIVIYRHLKLLWEKGRACTRHTRQHGKDAISQLNLKLSSRLEIYSHSIIVFQSVEGFFWIEDMLCCLIIDFKTSTLFIRLKEDGSFNNSIKFRWKKTPHIHYLLHYEAKKQKFQDPPFSAK